jgi:hypothetical protein
VSKATTWAGNFHAVATGIALRRCRHALFATTVFGADHVASLRIASAGRGATGIGIKSTDETITAVVIVLAWTDKVLAEVNDIPIARPVMVNVHTGCCGLASVAIGYAITSADWGNKGGAEAAHGRAGTKLISVATAIRFAEVIRIVTGQPNDAAAKLNRGIALLHFIFATISVLLAEVITPTVAFLGLAATGIATSSNEVSLADRPTLHIWICAWAGTGKGSYKKERKEETRHLGLLGGDEVWTRDTSIPHAGLEKIS